MSVLGVRPIGGDQCSPPGGSCGMSPPGMNYEGGDCLPGLPGPIPTPSCGGYSSGSPFEGSPDCPECIDYSGFDWSVSIITEGKATISNGTESYKYMLLNPGGYEWSGPLNPSAIVTIHGKYTVTVIYTGLDPVPPVVRLEIIPFIGFHATTQTSPPGGAFTGSYSADDGFGDRIVPPGSHSPYDLVCTGHHVKKFSLDEEKKVEFTVSMNARLNWSEAADSNRPANSILAEFNVNILPCEGE